MQQVPIEKVVVGTEISGVIAHLHQGDVAGFQIRFSYWNPENGQAGEKDTEPLFVSDRNLREVMAIWQRYLDENARLTTPSSGLPS